ncbi:MAG: response regulator [Alistipes sp.]|nr:response regulator [Alistipes sp.]
MGMGLLNTRELIRTHKGRISFESTPGKGTTFTVTLPLRFSNRYRRPVPQTSEIAGDQAEIEVTEASHRNHIVLLEDDPDMLAYIKQALENEYKVTASTDSLQMFKEIRRENPDLIITDVAMPRLRGDELCRLVKTDIATSHIPVILLSGLASREDIIAGLEVHADDYVVKPFDIILLKARIRNIIKSRRVLTDGRKLVEEDFSNELDYQFMTKVMEAVDAHISDPEFSILKFCQELGMSHTSVYNKIKALTGQSLNEFIRIARLNRGKELLASRRYNISEVAYMVGFSDPKYFSTCFRKQFGISPSKL